MPIDRNEAAESLAYHKEEIAGHVHDAMQIVRSASAELGETFEQRARRYWAAHIQGALGDEGEFGRGSMFTMQDTINELQGKSDDELEREHHGGSYPNEIDFTRESSARRLVANLSEGEGTPGYDVPAEERLEIKIAKDILQSLEHLSVLSRPTARGSAVPANHPQIQLHLDEIRKQAERLIEIHSPESTVPAA